MSKVLKDFEILYKQNPMLAKGIIYQTAAETSLYEFIKLMWEYIEPGRKFRNARHIQVICEHLHATVTGDIKKLLINIPPGFSKSLTCNVFFPAWLWLKKPYTRFLTFSYASSLTERDNVRTATLVGSDLYRSLWGENFKLIRDSQTKIENDKTGWKIASSVGGIGTGERADFIICLTAQSMIQTNRGLISIGEIVDNKLDVLIAGYDEKNIKWQRIETWQKNAFRPLVEIQFEGGSIKCTEGHRIYTQRGLVPASEITTDDNLWSISGDCMRELFLYSEEEKVSQGSGEILQSRMQAAVGIQGFTKKEQQAMFGMREDDLSSTSTSCENSREDILQPQMPWGNDIGKGKPDVPRWHQEEKMRTVQEDVHPIRKQSPSEMLFYEMLRAIPKVAAEKVRQLQEEVQAAILSLKNVLQDLCGYLPFSPHERSGQWSLCSWPSQSWLSCGVEQNIQGKDKKERWKPLSHLWFNTKETWKTSLCTPHRLCEGESRRNEFDDTMQVLSRDTSWKSEGKSALEKRNVISVKKIPEKHECTYNLSVHPCHNFFADGILVKNCDDLNNIKDVESKVTRDETNRWYMEVLPSRVTSPSDSVFINIQQRSNEDDVSGLILSRDMGYEHLMLPMEFDPDRKCYTSIGWEDWRTEAGELLWPEVYDQDAVDKLKSDKEMSSYAYAGQYMQSPSPRGGGIIKEAWWNLYPKQGEEFDEYGNPVRALEFPEMDFIIGSVDGAFGEKQENDFSAMCVLGVYREDTQPKVMLMYAWQKKYRFHGVVPERRKGESQRQYLEREEWGLVERVAYTCHLLGVDRLLIENKASGISLGQELRRLYSNEKFGVELINPKGDKIARAHSVSHLFENGVISAPNREWATLAIGECSKFPKGHDDLPDCIFQALIWLRKTGWALRTNEHEEEIEPKEFRGRESDPIYDV